MDKVHLAALCDMAPSDGRIFENIHDLKTAQLVLTSVARNVTVDGLLERISYSSFPTQLLVCLPGILGRTREALEPAMKLLADPFFHGWGEWEGTKFSSFSDCYWDAVIKDRINRGDARRAWDETKKAIFWKESHLALSRERAKSYASEIYDVISKKEGPPPLPEPVLSFSHSTPVPALRILYELSPGVFPEPDKFGRPTSSGWRHIPAVNLSDSQRKMIAIARHFARKRNVGKQKKSAEK